MVRKAWLMAIAICCGSAAHAQQELDQRELEITAALCKAFDAPPLIAAICESTATVCGGPQAARFPHCASWAVAERGVAATAKMLAPGACYGDKPACDSLFFWCTKDTPPYVPSPMVAEVCAISERAPTNEEQMVLATMFPDLVARPDGASPNRAAGDASGASAASSGEGGTSYAETSPVPSQTSGSDLLLAMGGLALVGVAVGWLAYWMLVPSHEIIVQAPVPAVGP